MGRKTRLIYAGAGALALALPATAVALAAGPLASPDAAPRTVPAQAVSAQAAHGQAAHGQAARTAAERRCAKLFTVRMGEGAANLIYSGTEAVSQHNLEVLGYIERCQRNPAAQGFVRAYDHLQAGRLKARIAAAAAQRATAATQSSGAGGGWAIPSSVVQCESHGQNVGPNGAGASGYYQIIPSTWLAYGGGQYASQAYEATAAQQAAVASRIWDGGAGAGQWVCAG
jgi:hypothetical protein